MGIDAHTLRFIRDNAPEDGGRILMLGRQAVNRPAERAAVTELGRALDPGIDGWEEAPGSFEYVERLLGLMGLTVESLDISDYQGATLIHDLAGALPKSLKGRYAFVYDGGTTEHIFDLPATFRNIAFMLETGGILISESMLNGGPAHGLYQFGPELVWSYWKRGQGWEVMACTALPIDERDRFEPFECEDIGATGKRPKLIKRLPKGRTYLFYAVRKTNERAAERAYQGDYMTKWAEGSSQFEERQ